MLLKLSDFNTPPRPMPKLTMVFGQDAVFVQHIKEALIQNWLGQHPDHTQRRWHPDTQDWEALRQSLHQFDLFYEASLHDITLARKADDKAALAFVEELLDSSSNGSYVLSSATLELKQVQRYTSHSDILLCQAFTPSKTELLRHCQRSLFPEDSNSLAEDLAQTIYSLSQGNIDAYLKMLQQLLACKKAGQVISLDLVQQLYPDQSIFNVQDMIDACLTGNAIMGIKSMLHLSADRNNTTLIIWVIAQELRNLLNVAILSQTQRMPDVFDILKIWPKKRPLYQTALRRLTLSDLKRMTIELARLDEAFKTFQEESLIQQGLLELSQSLAQGRS